MEAVINSSPMKVTKRLRVIALLGVVAIVAVWQLRARYNVEVPAPVTAMPGPVLSETQVAAFQTQISQLQTAIAKNPSDVNYRWALADAYQQMGEVAQAGEELKQIVRLQPQSVDARLALANVQLAMKQLKPAEASYREVVRLNPKSAEAWRDLGATLYHQARYLEAAEVARKAVNLKPQEPNNRYILATALLEYGMQFPDSTFRTNELFQARKELEKLQKIWPKNGDVYYRLGRACIGMRDGKSAIKYLDQAKNLSPYFLPNYFYMSKALLASGDREKARQVIEQALSKNLGDAKLLDLYGQVLQTNTDPKMVQRMFDSFQKAVELEPNNPSFREKFGVACLRLGKIDQAQAEFEHALRIAPERAFPYQQLSAIYTRKGLTDKATLMAKKSIGKVSNDQQLKRIMSLSKVYPRNVQLHLILADRFGDLGAYGLARDEYLMVQRLDPQNRRAKDGLAALRKVAANSHPTKHGHSHGENGQDEHSKAVVK